MQTTVSIPGIHCASCAVLIKDISQDFPSIHSVNVDLETKLVTINHDGHLHFSDWKKAVEAVNEDYKIQPAP